MTDVYKRKYWATRNGKTSGPHDSIEEALEAFKSLYPARNVLSKKRSITTGYGEFGPHFDIRWHETPQVKG